VTPAGTLGVISATEARPLMTPKQVAQRLGVSVSMVRKQASLGYLPAIYIGRLPRFEPATVETFLDRQRGGR
jgi:excisionase family DNA binding protein